ncbi:aldo/keto reductase [Metabacillus iocasae]|uniref:Aryl-alcohol dehydrogenase-like predicted oxidoreductase n=1 Tax=Priestia iocasae TaxID=2291674 RepID=A0ABS2QR02_9BACI|nr:aryl-alcohol dehydrogenase-like predicted oxidoreductase [Metabacillus iocasae]
MEKRQLGTSDLYVSKLGLGCMSLGKDEHQATTIIDAAVDQGINYLDTADLYDFGLNEEFVGKAIKEKRNDLILATKVGNKWNKDKDGWSWDPSKSYIKKAVKDSLQRLQTDYIDLYQLHGGTIEDNIDETIEAFEDLKKEGVIRYYGISSIRPNVIREYVEKSSIVSVMMQYSILDRRPEETVMPLLQENKISIVARGPVGKGLLTNKGMKKFKESFNEKGYLDYSSNELSQLLPELQRLHTHESLNATALHYCLHSPVVASVIAGASSMQQLKENVEAINQSTLTDEEYKAIQVLSKSLTYTSHR